MSEFLCFSNISEFPLFSSQTYDVLEIDASQEQEALKQALLEHSIADPSKYSEITRSYLVHWLIFREAKNLLQLESYPQVNELLWLARQQEQEVGGEIPTTQNLTSVSMESDLRDFIASNPHVISKGLELVQKEYPVEAIGRIDVLLKDKNGKFVVVETKKGRESDKVVGQILRYIGWIKRNMGDCTGIIVVGEPDERLEYAVEAISGWSKCENTRSSSNSRSYTKSPRLGMVILRSSSDEAASCVHTTASAPVCPLMAELGLM
jgi:RecB family endonuclease NucS